MATLIYISNADDIDVDQVNLDDSLWNTPASQAQIIASIAAKGWQYTLGAAPDPNAVTLTNMTQWNAWLSSRPEPEPIDTPIPAGATLPQQASSAPVSSAAATVLVAAGVVAAGTLIYLLTRR
jgi:hypothetical protein